MLLPLAARAEPPLAYVKGGCIYTARAADGRDERRVCKDFYPCISHALTDGLEGRERGYFLAG